MRSFKMAAIVALVAVSLGGCQFFQKLSTLQGQIETVTTVSVSNPITPSRLDVLEQAAIVVFTGLNAWRDSCESGSIPASCYDQIRAVQVYTRQIPPYLTRVRAFVAQNDQVNAVKIWNEIVGLITTAKQQAAASGVTLQGAVQ